MAYESNKVIPKETLSPESTGRRNTNGFIKENNSVGNIITTMLYRGCRLTDSSRTKPFPSTISLRYYLYDVTSQSDVGIK